MKKIKVVKRKKALFGADGAVAAGAILLASAANVAAQARQAIATEKSAREQAKAMEASARTNATALEKQSANNTQMQEKAIETNKQIAEDQRARQQDIQMTLQMLAGQQTTDERSRQNMQAVKYGGRVKATNKPSPLRGRNKEINITDGGSKQLLGITKQGNSLYKLNGDTHEESHKLPNGKRATGIGVNINNLTKDSKKAQIEAEGGEYALATPNDILFLSKHDINGFNPVKAVNNGVSPEDAFKIQEANKTMNYLKGKKRIKREIGGTQNINMQDINSINIDDINTANILAGAAGYKNKLLKYKQGGSVKRNLSRLKAAAGLSTNQLIGLGGAGANFVGNLIGAGIVSGANNRAASILSDAYNRSAGITADAYSRMHGISDDFIKDEDFKAAHYMPVVQDSRVSTAREDALATRRANAQRKAVQRNTMSSAAALNRLGDISQTETDAKIANQQTALEKANQIQQANAERVTQAAAQNAQLDSQSKKDLTGLRLQLLQYNNDIENTKIAGIAEAQSGAITNSAGAQASAKQANATAWGSSITSGLSGLASTANNIMQENAQTQRALLGATTSSQAAYYANGGGSNSEAAAAYKEYQSKRDVATDPKAKAEWENYMSSIKAKRPGLFDENGNLKAKYNQ